MKLRDDSQIRRLMEQARDEIDEATQGKFPADIPAVKRLKRQRARRLVKFCRIRLHRLIRDQRAA